MVTVYTKLELFVTFLHQRREFTEYKPMSHNTQEEFEHIFKIPDYPNTGKSGHKMIIRKQMFNSLDRPCLGH